MDFNSGGGGERERERGGKKREKERERGREGGGERERGREGGRGRKRLNYSADIAPESAFSETVIDFVQGAVVVLF